MTAVKLKDLDLKKLTDHYGFIPYPEFCRRLHAEYGADLYTEAWSGEYTIKFTKETDFLMFTLRFS